MARGPRPACYVFKHRAANVGESLPGAQIYPVLHARPPGKDRNVFPGMVCAGIGGIAAVIRRNDQ